MPTLKKLTFAPLFLIVFFLLLFNLKPLFGSYDFVFSLSVDTFIQLITTSVIIVLASFLFCLSATIANDWKVVILLGVVSALLVFIFLDPTLGIIFSVAILVSLVLSFAGLEAKLKSYLTFEPISLLGSSIRTLTSLLILAFALTYFLSINKTLSEKSFQIPDSLIDTALKLAQPQASKQQQTTTTLTQFSISEEQLELLKKNPELLKESGLDPKILDNLGKNITQAPQNLANELIKQTVKDQLQSFLKPYLGFIPAVFSVLIFLTLQSLTSIINLLIYPLLWTTFYLLEKSGFIKFTTEMRPVKKMVI